MIEYILAGIGGSGVFIFGGALLIKKLTTKPPAPVEPPFLLESKSILKDAGYNLFKQESTYEDAKGCEFCDHIKTFIQTSEIRVNPRGKEFVHIAKAGTGWGCLQCRYIDARQNEGVAKRMLFEDHIKTYSLKEKQSATPFRD